MKYFAYGINTNSQSMFQRCPGAIMLGQATLGDHRLRFSLHADVVRDASSQVLGLLWEVSANNLATLDYFEGYPARYGRRQVVVEYEGRAECAWMYYLQPGQVDCLPYQSYLEAVTEGYREHGLGIRQLADAIDRASLRQGSR